MIRIILILSFLLACSNTANTAQEIVAKSISYHGGEKFNDVAISFKFRDKIYMMKRAHDVFDYRRMFVEDENNIMDRYTNTDFHRYINGKVATIPDSMAKKYQNSVNSVLYFASLPFRLTDEAVILTKLDDSKINGEDYFKIKVQFKQANGGKDFEDVFCYWFNKKNYALDYMAYSFLTDGGGARFRVKTKTHLIEGIKLLDYDNYKPIDGSMTIEDFDTYYLNNKLSKISEINLENIEYLGSSQK